MCAWHGSCFYDDFILRILCGQPISCAVKSIFIIFGLSIVAIFSSACNTTIGLGRDMRILGQSMENQAQRTYHGEEKTDTSAAPVY